jgi:DNA-binding beta-propeller fold protein YncE
MGRLKDVPKLVLGAMLAACAGCGQGASSGGISPPPPAPPAQDFSLTLSSNSITVQQGATISTLGITVNGQNGFSGAVQVTLGGLPGGVASNPVSPFVVAANTSAPIVLGATANAATGNFNVTIQGTSNMLSHSANLALVVQKGILSGLSRTTFARTDSISAMDDPPGEPRHRRIAYDPVNKHLFVANRARNRVEVFSTADQTRATQISVPGASSADLSADGSTVWVGTSLEEIVAIDTSSLQIRSRYPIAGISPIPGIIFNRPIEVLAFSSGKEAVRLRQPDSSEARLALWDPGGNVLTDLTPAAAPLFRNGVGALARTGDHTKMLVAANDTSGEIGVFDANGNVVTPPQTLGSGSISLAAANGDGSLFAVVFAPGGNAEVLLLDGAFNQLGARGSTSVQGITLSRDGKFLYVSENAGGPAVVTVLDSHDLHLIGQVPDTFIQGLRSEIEESDETQLLFGVANRGVSFLDASKPGTLPGVAPAFAAVPSAQPSEGTIVGGTSAVLAGQNLEATAQVRFGTQNATTANVTGSSQIQTVSPPSVVNGAVNLTAYFPSGWLAIAPDAFSYGPQILEMLPNAGVKGGGDMVRIYGYGFGTDASQIAVKIGGRNAMVQKVENATSLATSFGLDATYPFSLERITLQTPAGTPGKVDVTVTSPAGTGTLAKSFQYLQSVQVFAKPALYKFVIYDQGRQRVYLSGTDHVDVFDLKTEQWLFPPTQPFEPSGLLPLGGPPPNAAIRGLSLTPDGSQLVAADFGAQSVYLLNPDTHSPGGPGSGTTVLVGGVQGFPNSGPARVAATSAQTVFISMSGEGGSGTCNLCLRQMDLTASPLTVPPPAPQPQVNSVTGAPLIQANASGDRVFLAFSDAPGGPVGEWDAATPNQFTTLQAQAQSADLAAAADATMFAMRANGTTEIRDAGLTLTGTPAMAELEQIPGRVAVPGLALHPTGAFVYQPFLTGPAPTAPPATRIQGGVDIVDAHSGQLRLRVFLPEPLAMLSSDIDGLHGGFLTVDENGQRIFALTTSGLTIVQLANVPLGIGSVTPGSGPAAGGTAITIRGSGFQSGIKVTIGGKAAAASLKDTNTVTVVTPALNPGTQQIVLTGPDGESVSLDDAFLAN